MGLITLDQISAMFPGSSAGPDIITLKTEADYARFMSQYADNYELP